MEEVEHLPPQSGRQVEPDASVPLEGIQSEGHTWCVYVYVKRVESLVCEKIV